MQQWYGYYKQQFDLWWDERVSRVKMDALVNNCRLIATDAGYIVQLERNKHWLNLDRDNFKEAWNDRPDTRKHCVFYTEEKARAHLSNYLQWKVHENTKHKGDMVL